MRRSICWLPSRLLLFFKPLFQKCQMILPLNDMRKSGLRELFLDPTNSYINYWSKTIKDNNTFVGNIPDWKFISYMFLLAQEILDEKVKS